MKITFTDSEIKYKSFLAKMDIPYAIIKNAYMRIEEVGATMCCGRANFNRYFLIIKPNTDNRSPYKMELDSDVAVKEALSKIKELVPNVEIGMPKQ